MQRVAQDLHDALSSRTDLDYRAFVLRSTWRAIHWKALPFGLAVLVHVPRMTRKHDIDVVLFSSMVTAALALPMRNRLDRERVRLAAIVHGLDVTLDVAVYQRFVPRIFRELDLVLPVSRATGSACVQRGLAPEKVSVVPNGIRLERFPAPAAREDMRAQLKLSFGGGATSLPDRAMLLCSVGRQVLRKGLSWFVDRVMPRLPDDVHYWIAGEEGPDTEAIEAAVRAHGLGARVRLLGKISQADLVRLYRGSDLFVMPNVPVPGDMEGFGVVMLEAGACGLPVVASRLEGIVDVVAEGRNGHLVETGDAEGFASSVMAYYRKPEGLALASRRARRYVGETFGWEAAADQYVEALRSLVG